jgi:hypothetical protein
MELRRFMRRVRTLGVCLSVPILVLAVTETPAAANAAGYAGYATSTIGVTFTSGTGRVQIPQLTCPASGTYMPQVTFGWRSSDLSVYAAVVALSKCTDGVNTAEVLTSLGGPFTGGLSASPGDLISGAFRYDSVTGAIALLVRNLTTAQKSVRAGSQLGLTWNSAVAQFYPDGPCIPFARIPFSRLTVDGKPLGTTLVMSPTDLLQCGRIAATTSPFYAAGKGFAITYIPA